MTVCIDADLLVKLVSPEPDSGTFHGWLLAHQEERLVSPPIMPLEVASALCRKIRRGLLTQEQGAKALALLAGLDIDVSWDWDLTERSLAIAVELGQPTAYDAAYLALAEKEQCELLTADAVFAGACEGKYRCVRLFRAQSV